MCSVQTDNESQRLAQHLCGYVGGKMMELMDVIVITILFGVPLAIGLLVMIDG